jgi:hypothetical protein
MSTPFDNEAKNILDNAPKPDADASTIKEAGNFTPEPIKEVNAPVAKKPRKPRKPRKKKLNKEQAAAFYEGARGLNGLVFGLTCAFTGTGEAWPEDDKAEVMDKVLARYLEIKDYMPPAEIALLQAYGSYLSHVATNETVKQNVSKRFGFFKRVKLFSKIGGIFKKKNKSTPPQPKKGIFKK